MEAEPREIQDYLTPDGNSPFTSWLEALRDIAVLTWVQYIKNLWNRRWTQMNADEVVPDSDENRYIQARAKIRNRLKRVESGNLGNYRSVGEGVCELKVDYGSGYRVYFGQIGTTVILLLCGGDKSTQEQDINKAKEYWKDYEKRASTSK
ncbi:type II toxin-antitoxin system RelE/ParE family toxin [Scytonema sp. UIC 10036]|uniref:type II toxin-antitoxin system RelE/ParE family toxin n=1 Tax=Scytonema sp. UIC 10036 TaxID=2304196 RepID=UPI00325C0FB7